MLHLTSGPVSSWIHYRGFDYLQYNIYRHKSGTVSCLLTCPMPCARYLPSLLLSWYTCVCSFLRCHQWMSQKLFLSVLFAFYAQVVFLFSLSVNLSVGTFVLNTIITLDQWFQPDIEAAKTKIRWRSIFQTHRTEMRPMCLAVDTEMTDIIFLKTSRPTWDIFFYFWFCCTISNEQRRKIPLVVRKFKKIWFTTCRGAYCVGCTTGLTAC